MNAKATWVSFVAAAVTTVLITWAGEADTLRSWPDLLSFAFVTKVVVTLVGLTGTNAVFAHASFRDPQSRTRADDGRDVYYTPWRSLSSLPKKPEGRTRPIGDVASRE